MKLSRRRVAGYVADGIETNRTHRLEVAAAWLVSSRQTGSVSLLERDIASILVERGYVTATAITASQLSRSVHANLTHFIRVSTKAKDVELRTIIDPTVAGGLKLTLPDSELDVTVNAKLRAFVTEMSL
jgi:F0F1-type ATP synthase delta subunit